MPNGIPIDDDASPLICTGCGLPIDDWTDDVDHFWPDEPNEGREYLDPYHARCCPHPECQPERTTP